MAAYSECIVVESSNQQRTPLEKRRDILRYLLTHWNKILTTLWTDCSRGWHINCKTNGDIYDDAGRRENINMTQILMEVTRNIVKGVTDTVKPFTIQHRKAGYFLIIQPRGAQYAVEFDANCNIIKHPSTVNSATRLKLYDECLDTFDSIRRYRMNCVVYVDVLGASNCSAGIELEDVLARKAST